VAEAARLLRGRVRRAVGRRAPKPRAEFGTVRHTVPMTSIDNAFAEDEVAAWDRRVRQSLGAAGELEYTAEPKFDGVSVSLRYEDGMLAGAGTRGDTKPPCATGILRCWCSTRRTCT